MENKIKKNCVIGIDPGLANTGYGVITYTQNRFSCIEYGAITTQPNISQENRLLIIFNSITELLNKFMPNEAGIENVYFGKNVTSAISVSEARGVVLLALAQHNIRVSEYAPNAIKKAVTGIATAEKQQVQEAVKIILGLNKIPKPDHAADALAAAITKINLGDTAKEFFCV